MKKIISIKEQEVKLEALQLEMDNYNRMYYICVLQDDNIDR